MLRYTHNACLDAFHSVHFFINYVSNTQAECTYTIKLSIITFSPKRLGAYCAIFRENCFVCSKLLSHCVITYVCSSSQLLEKPRLFQCGTSDVKVFKICSNHFLFPEKKAAGAFTNKKNLKLFLKCFHTRTLTSEVPRWNKHGGFFFKVTVWRLQTYIIITKCNNSFERTQKFTQRMAQ